MNDFSINNHRIRKKADKYFRMIDKYFFKNYLYPDHIISV